jgi:CheY-like chemotaxis protein
MTDELRTRVLVIEDNHDFAQLLGDILTIQGCDTEVAYDGIAGLEKAKSHAFRIIFSDITLPGELSGLDLAREVKADPDLAHVGLIAVSGYTNDEERKRALDAGFDLVFPKPVKFADLAMAIKRFSGVTSE